MARPDDSEGEAPGVSLTRDDGQRLLNEDRPFQTMEVVYELETFSVAVCLVCRVRGRSCGLEPGHHE